MQVERTPRTLSPSVWKGSSKWCLGSRRGIPGRRVCQLPGGAHCMVNTKGQSTVNV
ncbi:hypothetical protein C8Q80DRAFT_1210734, partial [Daedaleopsis nitida]